jgi:hypothetical protein
MAPRLAEAYGWHNVLGLAMLPLLAVLAASNWNKTHAARMMGDISRPALVAKMKRLGIPPARPGLVPGARHP